MFGSTILLGSAVLLAVFEIGSCVRCYQCNSQQDRGCGDPFTANANLLKDCNTPDAIKYNGDYLSSVLPSTVINGAPGLPRYCHKIVYQDGNVVRTCLDSAANNKNQTCNFIDNYSRANAVNGRTAVKHCSVCDYDKCNGAVSINSSISLALLALIASYVYYKQ